MRVSAVCVRRVATHADGSAYFCGIKIRLEVEGCFCRGGVATPFCGWEVVRQQKVIFCRWLHYMLLQILL